MALRIVSLEEPGFLYIKASGNQSTPEEHEALVKDIYEEVQKSSTKKVLIDQLEVEFNPNYFQLFQLVEYTGSVGEDVKEYKVATVNREEYKEFAEFWETVSANRGFDYKAFNNLEKAKRWLLND